MNKEDPYRKQAEKNRKRIVRPKPDPNDVSSSLPPRSKVHQEKKKKTVFKLKYPVIRLLVLFFVLLPITVLSIISYLENNAPMFSESSSESGYEEVSLEEKDHETRIEEPNKEVVSNPTEANKEEPDETSSSSSEQLGEGQSARLPASEGKDRDESPSVSNANNNQQTNTSDNPSAEVNKLSNKQAQKPEKKETESPTVQETNPENEKKLIYHTVKPGETLFRIAMTYYKDQSGIDIIRNANGLIENEIQTGQTLKIPIN